MLKFNFFCIGLDAILKFWSIICLQKTYLLMLMVTVSISFIYSSIISFTPWRIALCLYSLLSALVLLCYFCFELIIFFWTISSLNFSRSALISLDIFPNPIIYYLIWLFDLSRSFILTHILSMTTWVPNVVQESLVSIDGLKELLMESLESADYRPYP